MNKNDLNLDDVISLLKEANEVKAIISDKDVDFILEHPDKNNSLKNIILNRKCNFLCDNVEYQYYPYPENIWRKLKVQ